MIDVSVIIPTHNRRPILEKALDSFLRQDHPAERYEIIVVDDGSSDNTESLFTGAGRFASCVKYLHQSQRGPAAARNLGIQNASGELILIVNDDTIASPGLIGEHLSWHRKYPGKNAGVLGFVTWSKELKVTPFMRWLENGGPQFDYSRIKGIDATWKRFWTCNISLKREFILAAGLFNEEFPYAAWEDIELGYRLHLQGLELFYNRAALGYHYHPTSLGSIREHMVQQGKSVELIAAKVPLDLLPPFVGRYRKLAVYFDRFFLVKPVIRGLERIAGYWEDKARFGLVFDLVLLHYRLSGLRSG